MTPSNQLTPQGKERTMGIDAMSEFEMDVLHAIRKSLVDAITKGNWVQVPYNERPTVPAAKLREIYGEIDWIRVQALCLEKVEEMVAGQIVHSLATELQTDVKKIMCNNELREDIRATLREKIRKGIAK